MRYPARMKVVRSVVGGAAGALLLAVVVGGCQDPCVELAQRICNCEPTAVARRLCISNRITSRQGAIEVSDDDRALCSAKLDTCSCAALDQNDLDACGFSPVGDEDNQ